MAKLEEIRRSMESFNDALNRVRYDDYKKALYEQIQSIFGENSNTIFDSGRQRIAESSSCENKEECTQRLDEMREDTLVAFQREDIGGAMNILEEMEADLTGKGTPCRDRKCSRSTLEMMHQIKVLFSISDNLMFRDYIQPETGFSRLSSQGHFFSDHRRKQPSELEAKVVSELIAPLSNHYRIEILKMLAREEMSFTAISRALDLKTGHLQFHLKVLREADYIRANRRRRSYSVTAKGLTALEGLQRFAEGLGGMGRNPGK